MEYKEEEHKLLINISDKQEYDEMINGLMKPEDPRCLEISSKEEYEALIATGWPLLFMFVGRVWSCPKNPIYETAFHALAEELKGQIKLVKVDMIKYEEPARNYVKNECFHDDWEGYDPKKPIWCYFFISYYQGKIIKQHQSKQFETARQNAYKTIEVCNKARQDFSYPKDPKWITNEDWEIHLNASRKPFIIYFRTDHYYKTCPFFHPVEFLQRIIREFHDDIDFYKVDKVPGKSGPFSDSLFSKFKVEDLEVPFFVAFNFNGAEWVEVARISPNPIKSAEEFGEVSSGERFNHNEIYNLCVKLIKETNKDLRETPEIEDLWTKEQLELILHGSKKPVLIYCYDLEKQDEFFYSYQLEAALKSFRRLQVQYKDKIIFCQTNVQESQHRNILEFQRSSYFYGIFNEEIFGAVFACPDRDAYESDTPEQVVEKLENMVKEMSEQEYLEIPNILEYKILDLYRRPCFLAFYASLATVSLNRNKIFNKLYREYKDKVQFLRVEANDAFTRYILTKKDLPQGCGRKETEKIWKNHRISGYKGDLNQGFKIENDELPGYAGYFMGNHFEVIRYDTPRINAYELMEFEVQRLSKIRQATVPYVELLDDLDKYYAMGKPILFFFNNEFTVEISEELERIKEEVGDKVIVIRITRGGQIYEDFEVIYTWPAFCAVWNKQKIKKIDNKNDSDRSFDTFLKTSGGEVNELVQKLKKLADKYPAPIQEEVKKVENYDVQYDEDGNEIIPKVYTVEELDQMGEQMRKLSLISDRVSDLDESLVTEKGEEKKLWSLRANKLGLNDNYLFYATHEQSKAARLTDKKNSDEFYIKRVPQHLINFTNEKFYQIIYSPATPSIHDKFVEGRLMLDSQGTVFISNTEFTMWRIKSEDSSGTTYSFQDPLSKMVLCVWHWVDENIYQIYGVPENQISNDVKVTWSFEKSYKESMIGVVETQYNASILDDL